MAAFGLLPEDIPSTAVGLWPENFAPFKAFVSLSTQWRSGSAGPTGLDYGVLNDVFRLNAIPEADWPDTFAAIRVMEDAALEVMHKKD